MNLKLLENLGKNDWVTTERIFFVLMVLASLWPILATPVFAMLDAPAHMYNARLIYEMLFKGNEAIGVYYTFNTPIVPNWTGHIILVLLLAFFNAVVAQKLFIIIYLIAFPLSFRYLIKASKGNLTMSYFAFPLAYSFFFFLGFFNFLIGLPIMFMAMAYTIKTVSQHALKKYIFMGLFSLFIYLSHPILFAVWCVFIVLFMFYEAIKQYTMEEGLKRFFKPFFYTFLCILPSGIIAIIYLLNQPHDPLVIKLTARELWSWLTTIRAIQTFSLTGEAWYTQALFRVILFTSLTGLALALRTFIRQNQRLKISFIHYVFWFDMALVILILYFLLPDETNGGGYISSRLNLLFFVFLILGLSRIKQMLAINIFIASVVLILFHYQLTYYHKAMTPLNNQAAQMISITDNLKEGATLISIDKTQNWMQGHMCNYAGANKTMLMHQNYEASKKYFPLRWNEKERPSLYFGDVKTGNPCIWLMPSESGNTKQADYVLLLGNMSLGDVCDSLINYAISNDYTLLHQSEDSFIKLFISNEKQ